jgi:hypothetical protein
MQLNSAPAFESELDRLLQKVRQLREAAKPFVALQHYFEHGYTGPGNYPLTITREDLAQARGGCEVSKPLELDRGAKPKSAWIH